MRERRRVPSRLPDVTPATSRTCCAEQFYDGFCRQALWPLFHGFSDRVRVRQQDWDAYAHINELYARHAIDLTQEDATTWVHDYHLLLTARVLRELGHRGSPRA